MLDAQLGAARKLVLIAQRPPRKIKRLGHELAHIADAQRNGDDARSLGLARRTQHNIYDS